MSGPLRPGAALQATVTVTHPDWCDHARCTAALTACTGEAHRSAPVTVTGNAGLTKLTVTASLHQSHAPWLTSVLVVLDVTGLDHDFQPVGGTATLTVGQVADLGAMLAAVAKKGAVWQDQQITEHLAALRRAAGAGTALASIMAVRRCSPLLTASGCPSGWSRLRLPTTAGCW